MSKEWKCGDCCCFKTDSCLFGEMDENSSACSETVIDHKKAYQQGREDAIDEIIKKIKSRKTYLEEFHPFHSFHPNNSTAIAEANTYLEIAEELKEQKND